MSKYQDELNYQKACWNMKLNSQTNFRPTHLESSFNVLQEALNELEGTKQRLKRFDILRDEEYWRDVRLIEEVTTLREELEKGSGSEYVKELLDRIEDLIKEKLYGNDDE